jgi:hypothetical protein
VPLGAPAGLVGLAAVVVGHGWAAKAWAAGDRIGSERTMGMVGWRVTLAPRISIWFWFGGWKWTREGDDVGTGEPVRSGFWGRIAAVRSTVLAVRVFLNDFFLEI